MTGFTCGCDYDGDAQDDEQLYSLTLSGLISGPLKDKLVDFDDIEVNRMALRLSDHIEQGFMAMNRAIMKPQRIGLPEDEDQDAGTN